MGGHVKNHLNEDLFWLGIQILKKKTCFPTDVLHENGKSSKPLLFKYNVTSAQIPSGHDMNRFSVGSVVHAMVMNNMFCSMCSTLANGSIDLMEGIFDIDELIIMPCLLLVVERVIEISPESPKSSFSPS